MIIDGHAHACGEYLTTQGITDCLDRDNAGKVVLVPGESQSSKTYDLPFLAEKFPKTNVVRWTNSLTKLMIRITGKAAEIEEGNHYVYKLARECPDRIVQFYWVTQYIRDFPDELESRYHSWKFKGLKLHQCWENFSVESEFFRTTAGIAGKYDIPLFIHPLNEKQVNLLIKYKQSHRSLKLIIGHLFGVELFTGNARDYENIFFEISSPRLISGLRLKRALNKLGHERFILGSDTPYGRDNLFLNIKRINELPVSQNGKDAILGTTMKYLLKI